MISYEVYKIVHLSGIALILLGLGAILGAFGASKTVPGKLRMIGFLSHGLGMALALIGGFGMAARLGIMAGMPGWVYGKIIIWVLMGLGISLAKRKANLGLIWIFLFTILVAVGASLAIYKPGPQAAPAPSAAPATGGYH